MQHYYELILKNGSSLLVSTNEEGVCEFSINGDEFLIQPKTNEKGEQLGFSFSAARCLLTEKEELQEEAKGFSIISVKKASPERLKVLRKPTDAKERRHNTEEGEGWGLSMLRGKSFFHASRESVNALSGWR